ncbi:MAG: choice-of-anchor D domain-containing protein, partial [Chloroflexi bacterium]
TASGPINEIIDSTVQILAPAGRSPFEAIFVRRPAGYTGFTIAAIASGPAIQQPAHNFTVAIDPCLSTDPAQEVCGHLTSNSSATQDDVTAILTFYNASGGTVAQDRVLLNDGSGGGTVGPGQTRTFKKDRTGDPTFSTIAGQAEPSYPVDVNAATLSFPAQMVGSASASQEITLTNKGPRALAIDQIVLSGDFRQTNTCGTSVAIGASCRINVSFAPAARGTRNGTLTINDEAAGSPQAIPLSGVGLQSTADLNTSSLAFAPLLIGQVSAAQSVTVSNNGNAPLTIASLQVDANFLIPSTDCPSALSTGLACHIRVSFSPSQGGALSGKLSLFDNAVGSPQQVNLTGTGLGPGIGLAPSSVDFGNQSVGVTSSVRQVTLTNSGTTTLVLNSIAVSGDFHQANDCGTLPGSALDVGEVCTISVTLMREPDGDRERRLAANRSLRHRRRSSGGQPGRLQYGAIHAQRGQRDRLDRHRSGQPRANHPDGGRQRYGGFERKRGPLDRAGRGEPGPGDLRQSERRTGATGCLEGEWRARRDVLTECGLRPDGLPDQCRQQLPGKAEVEDQRRHHRPHPRRRRHATDVLTDHADGENAAVRNPECQQPGAVPAGGE